MEDGLVNNKSPSGRRHLLGENQSADKTTPGRPEPKIGDMVLAGD